MVLPERRDNFERSPPETDDERPDPYLESHKRPIATIAEVLDKNDIQNILWGTSALSLYMVPLGSIHISFIVPDDLLAKSREILSALDLFTECSSSGGPECPGDITHLHFVELEPGERWYGDGSYLSLFPISQVFHPRRLPDMSLTGQDIMLASDPRLPLWTSGHGCGRYRNLPPVRVLTPRCYTETAIRLAVRDAQHYGPYNLPFNLRAHWIFEWHHLKHVDREWPEIFDYKTLSPHFRWFWRKCRPNRPPAMDLREGYRILAKKLLPWPEETAVN